MLTIVGGTYYEYRKDTDSIDLYGSGLRAACALSEVRNGINVEFISCVGKQDLQLAQSVCNTFNIKSRFTVINNTVEFIYNHPLDLDTFRPYNVYQNPAKLDKVQSENIIYYGMIEADIAVDGNFVVYDPQNGKSFHSTGSKAKKLAIVLNKSEAFELSGCNSTIDLAEVGRFLLTQENANIVIIKNGVHGAIVIHSSGLDHVPIYEAELINPIGSGDIFTAAFAWQWIVEQKEPADAARLASQYTAQYCENRQLPLTPQPTNITPIQPSKQNKQVYLAGPFFNVSQRWLINELRKLLLEFGLKVFSPLHDVGLTGTAKDIASRDIEALKRSDLILAIADGSDSGTHFEIGFARAINKEVIVLSTNDNDDLLMLVGTGCKIVRDIPTAVYKASW